MTHEMFKTKKRLVEVLGLVSCFWLCSAEATLIIPKGAEKASEVQPESFESYQIRILRNQNQIQSDKIKALREELLEVSQKLHDLKPQLFKQGDPADQERIADLTIQLGQKEDALNRLSNTKRDMEQELSQARKKLTELDTIKDALTAMVDKQRTSKEQNAQNFKTQIEDMRLAAESERKSLKSKIEQHETQLERLKQAVSDKHKTVQRLDAITNAQEEALSQKQRELLTLENKAISLYDEILATTDAFGLIHAHKNNHIGELSIALSSEKSKNRDLANYKAEMQWLSDLSIGTQTLMGQEIESLRTELAQEKVLNAELAIAKAQLEQRRQELALITAANADHKKGMEEFSAQLQSNLAEQQLRTEVLENQFLGILVHQEASHHYAETLESMIRELDEMLAAKNQELEATNVANSHATGNLLLQLEQSQTSLEQHKGYREALESYLTLLEAQTNVHDSAHAVQHQKMEHGHSELYSSWQERLAKVQEMQEQKETELKAQLHAALQEGSSHQNRADKAEEMLAEAGQKVQNLSQELDTHQTMFAQKQEQLKTLEAAQAALYIDVDNRFKALAADLEREWVRSTHLESLLDNASNQITTFEKQTSQNDLDLEKLKISHVNAYMQWTDQIVNLQAALDEQQRKTETIISRTTQDIAETERQLSTQLTDARHHLAVRDEQFANLNLAHDYVKRELSHKITTIEEQLSSEKHQAQSLQEQVLVALAQIELEQSLGFVQSTKAKQFAKELEEKLQLLALAQTQTSTTDYDNQELVRQNESLLREISTLEQKLGAEQDKTHAHSQLVDQLRNDLSESDKQLRTIDELQQQVQRLEESVTQHHEQLQQEKAGHQETHHSYSAKLGELEHYHSKNFRSMEQGLTEVQVALRDERESNERLREDLKLSRKNYHQEHSSLRNLEEIATKIQTRSDILEDQLADTRLALSASKDEINLLTNAQNELMTLIANKHASSTQEVETERLARKNLQEQLDKALGLYENALHRNEELEQVNGILNEEARKNLALRDDVFNASQHNLNLEAQLESLQRRLDDAQRFVAENERHRDEDRNDNHEQPQNDGDDTSRLQKVNQIKSNRHQNG